MKISKSELGTLRTSISNGLAGIKITGIRKSADSPEVKVEVGEERYCFSKYLYGGLTGRWDGAEQELKIYKALNLGLGTTGGFLVPTITSNEVIELLKAKAVIRSMPGVRVFQMATNAMDMGRVDAGPAISWGGESTAIVEDTTLVLGKVMLQLKKCVCLYKVSRELLKYGSPSVDAMVKQELADALALAEDLAFLEGTGGTQPQGFYYHPLINNTDLSAAASFDTISDAMYQVERYNGMVTGWVAHPRVKNSFRKLKDANGNYLHADGRTLAGGEKVEMPTLGGVPISYSTQVPITLRPSSNETYIVGGQWDNLLIGEGDNLRIESTDTGGDAFEYDQTWIKAVREVDMALRHPLTFVRMVGIQA